MRKTGIGLLALISAAFVVGCGGDVGGGPKFVGEVDLKASASGPTTITPGTTGQWTFTVDNAGPEDAVDVAVELFVATPPTITSTDEILIDLGRWTCEATSGSCAAESGRGLGSTSVSLESGGRAVFTVSVPFSYQTPEGWEVEGGISVGQDGTYPDPTPGDNIAGDLASVGPAQALADYSEEIIYWALTDRFANGDPSNDDGDGSRQGDNADPSNHIGWHGGDFAGIRQKIEEGYFQGMGFTAIWISPVVFQVPALGNGNAAYHGYWPEATLEIEPHFGTIEDLKALVETAHANDIKIIVDFVANHVGYFADVVDTNRDWVRLGSECQSPETDLERACLGGLPDLKQENPEVASFVLEQLQYLAETTGLDAFRLDAQRWVNHDFWFDTHGPGQPLDRTTVWSVGENTEGPERMAFWMDTVGTPSTLDWPVYGAYQAAVAGFTSSLSSALANDGLYDDPLRLSTFLDNHDGIRAVSLMINSRGYERGQALQLLDASLTFLYSNRGIPIVYYGTEIGMEGIDDFNYPDNSNRKSMDFTLAGDPNVLTCGIADQGLDNGEAFGAEFFVRGGFNGWGNPPESMLVNLGEGQYASAFQVSAGNYEFKLASADWSSERTADVSVTLGEPVTLNTGGANVRISLAQDGCYQFAVDTSASADNPELTVTRLNVAAPLVKRLAELAQARQDYPALRHGSQEVVYDFSQQCGMAGGLGESPLPGDLFMRGGFNDWGATAETGFVRTGLTNFEAEFEVAAGSYGYKIAVNDWTFERVVVGQDTVLDVELPLVNGAGQSNGNLVIPADGCYNFALDAADLDAMTLLVTEDTDGTCQVVTEDPFGRPVFARGSFNGFVDPPPDSDQFVSTAPGVLLAKVGLPAGDHEYKIASADWSVERVVLGGPTLLDTSQLIGIPSGNGTISIAEGGCYEWTLDVADPEVAYLTVSKSEDGSDVFVLRRDLDGAASVVLVMNMGDGEADLGALGGISVGGLMDGPAVEITGAGTDLVISGGMLTGTVPARTAYLISDR
jgi:glycosidase